jgi:hypothetical protein
MYEEEERKGDKEDSVSGRERVGKIVRKMCEREREREKG